MVLGVTGATGLIGRHVVKKALDEGWAVRALCRTASDVFPEAEVVLGDMTAADSLQAFARGCDAVVHCAAVTSSSLARSYREVNLLGVQHLVEACRGAGVRRLVHVSTPSVLVDGTHQIAIDESYVPRRKPIGLYAQTKAQAEEIVRQIDDFEWVIVRPKAVFGPGDRTLLPELKRAILRGRIAKIGRDPVWVGLTYAPNVANALLAAATSLGIAQRTYHIDNHERVDLWTLVEVMRRTAFGSKKALRVLPYRLCWTAAKTADRVSAARGGWTGAQQYRVALLGRSQTLDCSAAKRDLDYRPRIGLRAGLAETLAGNPWGGMDPQAALEAIVENPPAILEDPKPPPVAVG